MILCLQKARKIRIWKVKIMVQKKTAWVLYYSNSGNTKKLADQAEETLKNCGWGVEAAFFMDFDPVEMSKPEKKSFPALT